MSLTAKERAELDQLEADLLNLGHLIKGGGSKNQLNRLLVLAQEQNRKLTTRVTALETKVKTLLELVRSLQ